MNRFTPGRTNKRTRRIIQWFFLCVVCPWLAVPAGGLAVTDLSSPPGRNQPDNVLVIIDLRKEIVFRPSESVKIRTKQGKKLKGRIYAISPDSLEVGKHTVALQDIRFIKKRLPPVFIGGLVLFGLGVLSLALMIPVANTISLGVGGFLLLFGPVSLLAGIILMAIAPTRKWKLELYDYRVVPRSERDPF